MRNEQRYCGQLQKYVWIQDLWKSRRKATSFRETWRRHLLMVLWCGRSCKANVWSDIASWRTKQPSNCAKLQLHALMTINAKKMNWDLSENCQKYALEVSSSACVWHALVDQTLHGQWTNLHEQSPNGPDLVTNAWPVWLRIYITQVKSSNIVMWETLHNNADWNCYRTLILPEILKTQNRPQEECCAYWEITRLFPQVGFARRKLLSHTFPWNLQFFHLMQAYAWTEFPLLIFGIWSLKCYILLSTTIRNPKRMLRETCCMTHHQENTQTTKLRLQSSTTILNYATSIMFPQTWSRLNFVRCCTLDSEAVIKMIIKGGSPTMRHASRNHRVALDWFFDRINLDPKNPNQICWHQKPTRRRSDTGQCHTWWMESSSPSVHFQRCQLPRNNSEKDATRNRRRENCGKVEADVEPDLAECGKLFYSAEFECVKTSGDNQCTQSARFESHSTTCREICRWWFK